jgi:hypothetical protein
MQHTGMTKVWCNIATRDRLIQFILLGGTIVLMMEAVSTYETSVNFYQTTRRNIPEDSHLHTRRRENLKSHLRIPLKQEITSFRVI